ncbi:MAG TPA: serine/threonine-protein kinase, partial [Labilithrix sp.]
MLDPSKLQPGYRLDRYELLCPLAYGGMAAVWLARFGGRLGFERLVVVKMILPQYSQDPHFQQMFLDEARIASKIEHANVARILDVGENDGGHFIVMEWVDGDSLSKVMRAADQRQQRVPIGVALRVIADAATGLHAAHALVDRDGTPLHVVHRDVSPQNILIANSGATVLIDFGVAKARDRVSAETSAGQLKGKIRYMAPEQAVGASIDHRADIWALGAILYEVFAGGPPYDGPNEVATLHKLTSGQPAAPLPADVPAEVQAICDRCLAHDPNDRYGSALELSLALEAALSETGEMASVAVVAAYTGQLLVERKAARKKAVDAALSGARARDVGSVEGAFPTGQHPIPPEAMSSRRDVASAAMPASIPYTSDIPSAPSQASHASEPSQPSRVPSGISRPRDSMGPMGLQEVPSATSSATLGSAAVEYPPPPNEMRRRRALGILLGVSVAAGLVGIVLIVSTALRRREAAPPPLVVDTAPAAAASEALPATTAT